MSKDTKLNKFISELQEKFDQCKLSISIEDESFDDEPHIAQTKLEFQDLAMLNLTRALLFEAYLQSNFQKAAIIINTLNKQGVQIVKDQIFGLDVIPPSCKEYIELHRETYDYFVTETLSQVSSFFDDSFHQRSTCLSGLSSEYE